MNKEFIMECLTKQKKILEDSGYKVIYICLFGSQNYGLEAYTDEYQSDIDMRAIIAPTLDDLVHNCKPISTKVDTEWGQCDLKDIRSFTETLVKANPAYIEALYTPYHIIDELCEKEIKEMISMRNDLLHALRAQFIRGMYGMMCEKEKAMCHPYPTILHKIEKFGYDGKQVHHIQRLWLMMKHYFILGVPMDKCFMVENYCTFNEINYLMALKLNTVALNEAKEFVKVTMEEAQNFKNQYLENVNENTIDYTPRDRVLELSKQMIKRYIVSEILGVGDK